MLLNFKKIFVLGLPFLAVVIGLKLFFKPEGENFWIIYILAGLGYLLMAIVINLIYNVKFTSKMKEINKFLENPNEINKFVFEMEKMEKKHKNPVYKNMIILNLSYGYLEQQEYEKSLSVLKKIDTVRLRGTSRIVFALNKCATYFYLELYDEFISLKQEFEKELDAISDIESFAWKYKANEIFYQVAIGNYKKAKNMLKVANKKWRENKMKKEWYQIKDVLEEKLGYFDLDGEIEEEIVSENQSADEEKNLEQ